MTPGLPDRVPKVPRAFLGPQREAAEFALPTTRQVESRVTPQVALTFTPELSQQVPCRLDLALSLPLPFGFIYRIAVGFESEIDREVAAAIDFGLPSRVALGTVPGTVPTVVPEASV